MPRSPGPPAAPSDGAIAPYALQQHGGGKIGSVIIQKIQKLLNKVNKIAYLFIEVRFLSCLALQREIARDGALSLWWVASRPCRRGFFMSEVGFQCGSGVCFVQNRPQISTSLRQTTLHEHGFQVTGKGISSLRTQTANFLRLRRK